MRTTADIDEQVYRSVRERALRTGISVGRMLGLLVEQALAAEAAVPLVIKQSSGFNVVAARPGSPLVTTASVQRALDEEGAL